MKKFFLPLFIFMMGVTVVHAQLPAGSIAPDFTVTDLNGNTINLYSLLDNGKTVYLDFFATWCGPCWNYKNTGALETIWDTYGPPGTNEAYVIAIESDAATNTACLYGPSGCVGGTQGNWVAGTNHPIVDNSSVAGSYAINYYPTIYMVCSDHKIYETGQLNATGLWAKRSQYCAPPPLVVNVDNVTNVKCFGTSSGAINISVTGGVTPYTYHWSNNATTQDISNLAANTYTCTITAANGTTITTGPIVVNGPSSALGTTLVESTPMGCNGVFASLTVGGTGGWGNYSYLWNGGSNDPTINGLVPGNYTVTVTDNSGCSKSNTFTVAPAVYPTAVVAPPASISCLVPSIQLSGSGSSSGPNFSYLWTASNGGNIVSGATTLTPTVNAGGIYSLRVTNTENNCSANIATTVTANLTAPSANAGPVQNITCTQNSTTLQGSGSTGSTFSYLWTASNGGNISSGSNTLNPTVNAVGTYTLKVTNSTNGCTSTSTTSVTGTAAPLINTTSGSITCAAPNITLTTNTNASNPGFAWTGPNNYSSNAQNPVVNVAGSYNLVVTDSTTGCTSTASASVAANNNAPGATAAGGTLTCIVNNVVLSASSSDTAAVYAWTGPNNFSSNLKNPTVNVEGTYNLVVSSPSNGCTSTASAAVALNNTAPSASIAAPGTLNCNAAQVQLNASGSSQGNNFAYNWTTTNGNIVSGGNTLTPIVNQAGTYVLQINNNQNGCTTTGSTNVELHPAVTSSLAAQTNVSCNGGANGAASITANGGNGNYSYLWSNSATTASISNVAAGTYQLVITDGENCTATATIDITQPAVLLANASATPQSANGVNDGTASAAPSGGNGTYAYIWNNNETTQTIANLVPGIYTVTVTDQNNCTNVQTVSVNAFNCTLAAALVSSNVSCFGAANGSASVNLSGASNPVTYNWSNGATTASIANLTAGTYTVNLVDGNNCPASLNISITEPAVLTANATATNETSAGGNNGTAVATPVGGNSPYTFLWSNGVVSGTLNNLIPGIYTVTVTDVNACTAQQSVTVNPFMCTLGAQTLAVNASCAGSASGSVSLNISNGAAPFTYQWSNGASTSSLSNVAAGSYTVTLTDGNACSSTAVATVTEPLPFSQVAFNTVNPVCAGEASGMAAANVSGGTQPYSYMWSNGTTGASAINLVPGTYTVQISDANNCQTTGVTSIVATDNVPPSVSIQNATLPLNAGGVANVNLVALNGTSADNCGVVSIVFTPASFNCDELGVHTVTVKVSDGAGLSSTATAEVTVVDNIAPVLTCPNSITRCAYDNIVSYAAPVAVDNCLLAAGGQWSLDSGLPSGSEFPIGVTTQIYSFRDGSGNKGTCSFEVVITTPVQFEAPQVTNDVNNQGLGAILISLTGGNAPLSFVWTKNEQVVGTSQNLSGVQAGSYNLQVTDASGCVYEEKNIVVSNTTAAHEPQWLSGVRIQPNPTSGIAHILFDTPLNENMEISVIDQTGRQLVRNIWDNQNAIQLDCSDLPSGVYTIRFSTQSETGIRKLVISK